MQEDTRIRLAFKYRAKEGMSDRLVPIIQELAALSEQEPGCAHFLVAQRDKEFFFFQEFSDQEALDAHKGTPHYQAAQTTLVPFLELPRIDYTPV